MLPFNPLCAEGSVCLRAAALAGALAAAPLFASADEFRADLEDAILFGKRMALYENAGGPTVRNFRYDRRHTAVGVCQMTDTTWREIAPASGIDIEKFRTAGSASEHQQWQVCWRLHVLRGYDPWSCCNTSLSEALGETTRRRARTATTAKLPSPAPQASAADTYAAHQWHDASNGRNSSSVARKHQWSDDTESPTLISTAENQHE